MLGKCQCDCNPDLTYGNSCQYGFNETHVILDNENMPPRKVNFSLTIMKDFSSISDQEALIAILEKELTALFRQADPSSFKDLKITGLSPNTNVEVVVSYSYQNNESQINFLNEQLETTLKSILDDPDAFKNLSEALGNVDIKDPTITMTDTEIKNLVDMRPYVNCSLDFSDYSAEVSEGHWICVGPCFSDPGYCNHHGECLNEKSGPVCRCYENFFETYYGPQCDLYSRGAGFYAVLFGCLSAVLLLLTVIVSVIVVLCRPKCCILCFAGKRRRRSFESTDEEIFDFSNGGHFKNVSVQLPGSRAGVYNIHSQHNTQ